MDNSTLNGYAVCKDCGTGTMNNRINNRFLLSGDGETAVCGECGSTHIDGELYIEEPFEVDREAYEIGIQNSLDEETL